MSDAPLKDARAAGVKCVGFTNTVTGLHDSRIPTQTEVDQEEASLPTPEQELQEKREDQVKIILESFSKAEEMPVEVQGIGFFWADVDSALRLDGARRAVIEAISAETKPEDSTVPLTDVDRKAHNLSLADALVVCLAVADRSQADFSKKQSLIVAINQAKTIEEVNAVVW